MKVTLIITLLMATIIVGAQKKDLTLNDAVLGYQKGLYPTNIRGLQWVGDSKNYSFVEGSDLIIKTAKQSDQKVNVKDISAATKIELKRMPAINWTSSTEFYFQTTDEIGTYNIKTKKGSKTLFFQKGANYDYHSSTNAIAYTKDNNLYVTSGKYKDEITVTKNEDKNIVSGQAFARFEFGISKGTFWSPNGNNLAFYQKDESNVHDYPLLDVTQTPGELKSIKYPMAGQSSEFAKVGVFNIDTRALVYLDTEQSNLDKEHYLTNLTWGPKGEFIYLAEVNRDQNHMKLTKYNASTGAFVKVLFEEKNERYVEPEHPLAFLPNNDSEFLWFSERDGFMNLFQYNTEGKLIKKVTEVDWEVQAILGYSSDNKSIYIQGAGKDAREVHTFKFNLSSGKSEQITKQGATHRVKMSKDGSCMIDSYSSLEIPKKIDIVNTKTKKVNNILTAENPLQDYKHGLTEFVNLKSDIDGATLNARIIKPSNFDPNKKYPVLVYVYGGPHAQLVTNTWLGGASMWMNWMAEQDYIVFTVDGHGSGHRGFEFESIIHRNLGDNEIKDQLTGVEYLKTLPYVDQNRMAVHGWSFGGFMTTSLMLKQPGVFKVGVAGGPVIDWKWYEIMYGERYMDTPEQNPEGYRKAGLLDKVSNLEGDLLMIHGTVDDVVVMQHNLAFVKSCVEAGVQIDFFPYPNHPHNVRGKDRVHLMTKVLGYVMDKLD